MIRREHEILETILEHRLTHRLATALQQIAAAGVKSENEGKIVFVQGIDNPSGAVGNIFTINPDGTDLRQLTSFGSSGEPEWWPSDWVLVSC